MAETVDVGGLRIAYERRGRGRPLVLLHGGACDRRVWDEHVDAFAPDHTVVAWDAPGCGGSADPPPGFTLADYADVLRELVRALALTAPHVVGHSWAAASRSS